jgi:hypothetical protein
MMSPAQRAVHTVARRAAAVASWKGGRKGQNGPQGPSRCATDEFLLREPLTGGPKERRHLVTAGAARRPVAAASAAPTASAEGCPFAAGWVVKGGILCGIENHNTDVTRRRQLIGLFLGDHWGADLTACHAVPRSNARFFGAGPICSRSHSLCRASVVAQRPPGAAEH